MKIQKMKFQIIQWTAQIKKWKKFIYSRTGVTSVLAMCLKNQKISRNIEFHGLEIV